jgi:hypothetical protein
MNLNKVDLPNPRWNIFQNKIIVGQFSDDYMEYIKDLKFDCFSKIDGTNSKIVYYPSTGECFCGGKTDNADIIHTGQKDFLDNIITGIKPILTEIFPPESAKFAPAVTDNQQSIWYELDAAKGYRPDTPIIPNGSDMYVTKFEESPIYIYGEFFGKKIQAGYNYDKENNRFNVFDICQQGWFIPIDILQEYCGKLGLDMVPYLGQMSISEAEQMVSRGFKTKVPNATNPDYMEEGIVARPVIPIKDPRGKRIIVKIKSCDYMELNRCIELLGVSEFERFHNWYTSNQSSIESL